MYSYEVAGANLFGQWFTDEVIIEEFKRVSKKCPDGKFDLDKARLVQATWSYNIFEIDGVFYVSGSWAKEENQLVIVPLPIDFPKDCITMLMVGNDSHVHMIDAEKQEVFVVDLKFDKQIKRVNLALEHEESVQATKKTKKNNQVLKAMMTSNAGVLMRFINREVKIYAGLHPCHVPTDHVNGRIIDVQCGYEHYMLLTDTGKVYTWGCGRRLQLGHGGVENVETPSLVRSLAGLNIRKIRAGGWHSAVVSEFGDLYMWGWNDVGQLGIKSRAIRRKELRGPSDKIRTFPISTIVNIYDEELNSVTLDIIDVSCGSKHTVIMLSDYSIWTAGSNAYGQLGLPIQECTHSEHYVKVHQGTKDTVLHCGPWTTIIEN